MRTMPIGVGTRRRREGVPTLTGSGAAIQAKPLKQLARMGIIGLDHPIDPSGSRRGCAFLSASGLRYLHS